MLVAVWSTPQIKQSLSKQIPLYLCDNVAPQLLTSVQILQISLKQKHT